MQEYTINRLFENVTISEAPFIIHILESNMLYNLVYLQY